MSEPKGGTLTQTVLRIATRSSALALWQARHVADLLQDDQQQLAVELVHVSTQGDREQGEPLRQFGGLGVFTREVQRAVLDGEADLAVHSLKDLPTAATEGLTLACIPARGPLFDALVLPQPLGSPSVEDEAGSDSTTADNTDRPGSTEQSNSPAGSGERPEGSVSDRDCVRRLDCLPPGARVGTGSPRRQAQLRASRPDLQLLEVRGNVGTRLRKLDEGQYDALILAEAGLVRLGLADRISHLLEPPLLYPAISQGALGLECRCDDTATIDRLAQLIDPQTHSATTAERSLLRELRAGCHAPVGAYSSFDEGSLQLTAVVLSLDGQVRIEHTASAELSAAEQLGVYVARELLKAGAETVIQQGDSPDSGRGPSS